MFYFTTEINILKSPEKIEEHWNYLESQIIRSFQVGTVASNLYIFSKFVANTNFSVLQSFYPEPGTHKNPINK